MYNLKCRIPRGGLQGSKRAPGKAVETSVGLSCSQPLYRNNQVDDFLEIQHCDCSGCNNRQMSGKSEILGLPCALGRTTKNDLQPGSMHPAPCSALLVAGTRIIDGCSPRCASGVYRIGWSRLAIPYSLSRGGL